VAERHLLERRSLRRAFDQAADSYDSVANLQRDAAQRLIGMLGLINAPQRILDLGCGTGYAANLLATRFPAAQLLLADIALSMTRSARRAHAGIEVLCADAQALPLKNETIDLLWSNCMLQWCNELAPVFAQFHGALKTGGVLAFSSFGPATLEELRQSFDDSYTHVSRFVDVEMLMWQLHEAGFVDVQLQSERRVIHYADVLTLMRELKALGANNATRGRARGLSGRRAWLVMLARYETHRTVQGLPATYELIYATAFKPGASRGTI
jgi:malonyl-CoA O-methyltransferase